MDPSEPLKADHLGHDIWVYHDVVSDDLCSRIIDLYDKTDPKLQPGTTYDNRECEFVAIGNHPEWADIDKELVAVVFKVLSQHYAEYNQLSDFSDEGYEVCCYEPGQICRKHTDGTFTPYGATRMWALVIYLSDTRGGEVLFTRQNISVQPRAGLAAVWPPHMTHPHLTLPSPDRRFMMVTWSTKTPRKEVPSAD